MENSLLIEHDADIDEDDALEFIPEIDKIVRRTISVDVSRIHELISKTVSYLNDHI